MLGFEELQGFDSPGLELQGRLGHSETWLLLQSLLFPAATESGPMIPDLDVEERPSGCLGCRRLLQSLDLLAALEADGTVLLGPEKLELPSERDQ